MKNIYLLILLFSGVVLAQDFEKEWNKVIVFENAGKTKSAAAEVHSIYKKAKQQNNESQIIKCFFYNSKYLLVVDEEAQLKIIAQLEKEIATARTPSKAILNFVYANCLKEFYAKNRYNNRKRTKIDSVQSISFLTYSNEAFEAEIAKKMELTLANPILLKQTPLLQYEPIFDFLSLEKFKTQTLFDYFIKENIAFHTTKIDTWEINAEDYKAYKKLILGETADFVACDFGFVTNHKLKKVLLLMQEQEKNTASTENQFERIQFCSYYILKSKADQLSALDALSKKENDLRFLQKILYNKAIVYTEMASKVNYSDYNVKAIAALDSVLLNNNHTNVYKLAMLKKREIVRKSLSVNLSRYNYNNENTRAHINYKNIDTMQVSFFKISQKNARDFDTHKINKDSLTALVVNKKTAFKTFDHHFKNSKDYFNHSTEILMPQLPIGIYLVCFKTASKGKTESAFDVAIITVSDFILLTQSKGDQEVYQVLNRKTGMPIEEVSMKSDYFNLKTDQNGLAYFRRQKAVNNFMIEFSKANDSLALNSDYYYYEKKENDNKETEIEATTEAETIFYLDRAIYRPGQTVYYKGITYQNKNNKKSVLPNLLLKIIVENPNNEDFLEFEVTTNAFGSFSGELVLPKTGLTGNFRMRADEPDDYEKDSLYDSQKEEHPIWDNMDFDYSNSTIDFKVEEYKRPKFEVHFEPVTANYFVNQKINVDGMAKSFSGSTIVDAKVTYTVARTTEFYRNDDEDYDGLNDLSEKNTIGTTSTDASGKFSIDFIADPITVNSKKLPVFNYIVNAVVTDSNGESHSTQTTVKVGYHSLVLSANVPTKIDAKKKNSLVLNSTNLNGTFVATEGNVKIYFVKGFQKQFKNKYYSNIDGKSITDEDFEKLFPFEKHEKSDQNDTKEVLILDKNINTKMTQSLPLDFLSTATLGYYRVVFSAKDQLENYIESKANFQLYSAGNFSDDNALIAVAQLNEDPKKDGFVMLKMTSRVPELYVMLTGHYNDSVFIEKNVFIEKYQTTLKIPIDNRFTDSVIIGIESIFDNEHFKQQETIILKTIVPSLGLEVQSFRSKIEPGTNETWSFQLQSKNTADEVEILASMYDSALDQFYSDDWEPLSLYKSNYSYPDFKSPIGFKKSYFDIGHLNPYYPKLEFQNETIKLLQFGFNFMDSNNNQSAKEYKNQLSRKSKKPANAKLVSGYVTESKLALPGVIVTVGISNRTTQTDFDGYFEIEAAFGEELVFTYLGFLPQKVKLASDVVNITLKEDSQMLQEVVVVSSGYGSSNKKAIAYSVLSINAVEERANAAVLKNLQGQVAGLNIAFGSGQPGDDSTIILRGVGSINGAPEPLFIVDGIVVDEDGFRSMNVAEISTINVLKNAEAKSLYGSRGANGVVIITTKKAIRELSLVKVRANLKETAFFFPNLKTDKTGKLQFNFIAPEALTEWKLRLFAHNKEAVSGYLEKNVVTQKEIMVVPNFPRFFREKDTITLQCKIVNSTSETKTGTAILQLFDATTMLEIDAKTLNNNNIKSFKINGSGSTTVHWTILIPEGLQGIQYKILAKAENFSDGEESILPVLTNSILVTESIPLWLKGNSKKEYVFENLKNNVSTTLQNHQLTFEYTSNPTWLALQSLPYLMEFEHECAEQTFARWYANAIATSIINSNPKIATLFENWKKNGQLVSKLEQNEALKSLLLTETPWFNDAQSEDQKKQQLAMLFDLEKMKSAQDAAFEKLKQKQKPSGGFGWFDGGEENEYITRHILSGFGHLKKLNISSISNEKTTAITKAGIAYLDNKFLEKYKQNVVSQNLDKLLIFENANSDLHYLYTRSFYIEEHPLSDVLKKFIKIQLQKIQENWLQYSIYQKGMSALLMHRFGEKNAAKKILESLKETAANNEDAGMFWIANKSGSNWYEAPIETQALLIEAFFEINNDKKAVDAMKVWLLKSKQTKNWSTTKATTEAVYALLMHGSDWLTVKDNTTIGIGDQKILTKKLSENEKEAATGYVKLTWNKDEIKKEMASISIENRSNVPAFGGVYWQYFEDLDNIKTNISSGLSVLKELYLKKNTEKGDELQKITSNNPLKIGDLVTVRLIIICKQDMEFVHLKDMRASCFEPITVLSQYKYQDRLGYYESTKDAATHFFFDKINKGTFVLEYDIRVNNSGNFSNGITTMESMYAPEFSSHTKGIRVEIKEK